jgi:hypothetical protein
MAEQTIEERLNELKQKQDYVGDPFGANDLRTLIEGIEYAMSHGGNVSVAITPLVGGGGYKITINDSEGIAHDAIVKDGGDAYAVYESTVPEGQTPMSKTEWLASLKGNKGDDAVNPFKGWFEDVNDLPTNADPVLPVVGDYAYVNTVNDSDPQNPITTTYVYRCVTEGEWPSSSSETTNPSNNPSFRSGETIHNIPIDNSRLANPSTKALAKAIDVVAKIQPLDFAINGNPGSDTYQEINAEDYGEGFFTRKKKILLVGEVYRVKTLDSFGDSSQVHYYAINNGDKLQITVPKTGSASPKGYIIGISKLTTPLSGGLATVYPTENIPTALTEDYTINEYIVNTEGAKWLCVGHYGEVITDGNTTYDDTDWIPTVKRVITTGQTTGLLDRVEALEQGIDIGGDGILDLNPEKEIVEKLKAARYTNTTNSTAITFAHISDVHGNTTKFERFLEFASHYKDLGYIADAVDTGDLTDTIIKDRAQFANYNSETRWYDPTEDLITAYNAMHDEFKALDETERVLGFKNVLLINGNHDTDCGLTYNDGTDIWAAGRWLYFVGKPVYDREFIAHAELESGTTDPWGNVVFPDGAGSNDYYPCYYHKDYDNGIRAVFVDVMDWGIRQQTWLNDVLAAALSSSKHVIIFTHYLNDRKVYAQCSYNGFGNSEDGNADLGTEHDNTSFYGEMTCVYQRPGNKYDAIHANPPTLKTIAANVQDFIDNGGIFVGYIGGHRHYNAIGYLKLYPKQWFALITSANTATKGHDYPNSGRAVDNFQLVTVNPYRKTLILTKIGGQYNNKGCHTDTLGIDYEKHCIVSEGYGVMPKENKGASSNRPTLTIGDAGFEYFDTTLGKPIYWNGSTWIDGNGTNVDNE